MRRMLPWLVIATALAAALRLFHLGEASFWVDELNTIRATADLSNTHFSKVFGYVPTAIGMWMQGVDTGAVSVSHPETWRALGVTEFSARIGSAVCGIATIPVLGWLSSRLIGVRAAVVLSLMLAASPWHIYWSQASRFYTLQFLFYNLCLLLYFLGTGRHSKSRMIMAMGFMVLAFFAQPPALVIVGVFAVDWILQWVSKEPVALGRVGWVSAIGALVVCAAVLAGDVWARPEQWTQFAGDLYQTPGKVLLGTLYMVGVPTAVFSGLAAWSLFGVRRRLALFLGSGAIVPPLAFAALSLWSYVGLRYAFVCLLCWLLLAAIGAEELRKSVQPRLGAALANAPVLVLLSAMMLTNYGYFTSGVGYHTRWKDAFEYVAGVRASDDIVCTSHPMIGKYYLGIASVRRPPKTLTDLHTMSHSVWVVEEAADSVKGFRGTDWIEQNLQFRAHFDVRVAVPFSSVRVYYYEQSATTGVSEVDAPVEDRE